MYQIVEDFKISLIEDGKSAKTIESHKNFLVERNYEVATINKKVKSIHALNRYFPSILLDLFYYFSLCNYLGKDIVKILFSNL